MWYTPEDDFTCGKINLVENGYNMQ